MQLSTINKSQKTLYRASFVLTFDTLLPLIKEGGILVSNSKIIEIGFFFSLSKKYPEAIVDESADVLMPGLTNNHCHLELPLNTSLSNFKNQFIPWIQQLQSQTKNYTKIQWNENLKIATQTAIQNGTTHLIDVGNSGHNLSRFSKFKLPGIYYWEAIGIHPKKGLKYFKQYEKNLQQFVSSSSQIKNSISAHAPFSCSLELLKKIIFYNQKKNFPFVMHLAESEQEELFFKNLSGELFDFCQKIEPSLTQWFNSKSNVFDYLRNNRCFSKNSVMVHCNTLTENIAQYFSKHHISIVHCPKSHDFFDHPRFPYELCQKYNLNVLLGTDSLSSNDDLNLFSEMRYFHTRYPQVALFDTFKMVTTNSASAWPQLNCSGQIKKGDDANFIGLKLGDKAQDLESILNILIQNNHQWSYSLISEKKYASC